MVSTCGATAARLRPLVAELKSLGVRVSLFMDAGTPDVGRAAELGADRIELYTGPYRPGVCGR